MFFNGTVFGVFFFYFVFYSWGQLIYLLRLGHEVYYPGWEYWNQRRFQSSERGRCFAEKLLAVQTAGLAEPRIREFLGSRATREPAAHSQADSPSHTSSLFPPSLLPSAGRPSLPAHPNSHPTPELPLSLFYSIFLCRMNPSYLASGRNFHSQYHVSAKEVSDLGSAQTGMLKLRLKAISTSF